MELSNEALYEKIRELAKRLHELEVKQTATNILAEQTLIELKQYQLARAKEAVKK